MHQLKGLSYENKARRFLNRQGLIFIDRNYHCRMGEIDLIMEDADTIVFIEVRYRKSELFGGAMASVTPKKQQRVIKAAQHYLNEKKIWHRNVRFDVIAFSQNSMDWLRNAFTI
jgi:putative endonuclease